MQVDPTPIVVRGQEIADMMSLLALKDLAYQDGTIGGLPLYRLKPQQATEVLVAIICVLTVELNAYSHSPEAKALQAAGSDFLAKLNKFVGALPGAPKGPPA